MNPLHLLVAAESKTEVLHQRWREYLFQNQSDAASRKELSSAARKDRAMEHGVNDGKTKEKDNHRRRGVVGKNNGDATRMSIQEAIITSP